MGVNVVDENGKRWAYPHEGAVMRANPDGSIPNVSRDTPAALDLLLRAGQRAGVAE